MGQKRGQLSERIQAKAKELLGRETTTTELRLMPYIQYVMVNDQRIEPRKCNQADRDVLSLWRSEGHIEGGAGGLAITKKFWNTICEIVFLGYVDLSEEEKDDLQTLQG